MPVINPWAVALAALSIFPLGAIWYSPFLFGRRWQSASAVPVEKSGTKQAVIFAGTLVISLVSTVVFAAFLGPHPALRLALPAGLSAGVCWVGASFAINYLFERRPLALLLINGGFHSMQFALYGLILGLLP